MSAYVAKDSDLDLEATSRATSIYLPTGNVNMFPQNFRQKSFHLLPEGEAQRYHFILTLRCDGEIKKFEVERSLIQVTHKLSYSYCDKF